MTERRKTFELSPDEYEQLVASIVDSFSSATNLEKLGSGRSNVMEGWSGIKHQIDVTFRHRETKELLLVECKQWNYFVELRDVLAFHSRIRDIERKQNEESLGFMATTKGFDPGAQTYASKYKIQLNTVKDAAEYSIIFAKRLGVVRVFLGERQDIG